MFCPTRGAKKYISSWTNTSVQRCLYHLFQNQSPIFCCPLFSENYLDLQVRINKMVSKHTVDYHPSPSKLISGIYPLIFLWTTKGFISPESFLNFFLNPYIPPWLQRWLTERITELKTLPKLTSVLVTSFDKFHHHYNLYIFGFCIVVQ